MKKKTKNIHYTPIIPKTVSVRELQRQYKLVREELKKEGTLMVMNYSEPDMVVMSNIEYEKMAKEIKQLKKRVHELEMQDTLMAIDCFHEELEKGTLKELKSLKDLR